MHLMTRNMTKETLERKRRFKASLALAGMTVKEWVAFHKCTATHFNEVINGNRVSARIDTAIDSFIARPRKLKAVA